MDCAKRLVRRAEMSEADLNASADELPKSFESALAELETIVRTMESGDLTLEQSLAAHRRGLALARYCQATLSQAQAQVRVLERDALKPLPEDL
jgi:exodeoxyribonuclease VII small subunit